MSKNLEEIVQQQVNAYIHLNLEAFVDCYANDVVTFDLAQNGGQGAIVDQGKVALKARFHRIFNSSKIPQLFFR